VAHITDPLVSWLIKENRLSRRAAEKSITSSVYSERGRDGVAPLRKERGWLGQCRTSYPRRQGQGEGKKGAENGGNHDLMCLKALNIYRGRKNGTKHP